MENLLGVPPQNVLVHGPKKLLLDTYHWHLPNTGIIASYTPKYRDVEDHFGVFRGVDQIESFAQATIVSCTAFSESVKLNCDFEAIKRNFSPTFISVGQVNFHSYLQEGDLCISIGRITSYKFRQMTCEGRIYKAPKGLDLQQYFDKYTKEQFLQYDLSADFTLVSELYGITGRAIRINK